MSAYLFDPIAIQVKPSSRSGSSMRPSRSPGPREDADRNRAALRQLELQRKATLEQVCFKCPCAQSYFLTCLHPLCSLLLSTPLQSTPLPPLLRPSVSPCLSGKMCEHESMKTSLQHCAQHIDAGGAGQRRVRAGQGCPRGPAAEVRSHEGQKQCGWQAIAHQIVLTSLLS